jgi:hypothetical protein
LQSMAMLQSTTSDFFSNPLVGIIGTIASIVGLLLAIYFYLKGKRVRKLAYQVNPANAVVVRAGQASKLKVTFNDRIIKSDVTAFQIALWNQGNQSIKPNNILKPIIINVEDAPILEASIRKMSRDIIDIELAEHEYEQGRIGISWKILEHNDGGVIQVIYEGDTDVQITVDGVIEGQQDIIEVDKGRPGSQVAVDKVARAIGLFSIVIGALMIVPFAILVIAKLNNGTFSWRNDWIGVFSPILTVCIGLLLRRMTKSAGPPFGY